MFVLRERERKNYEQVKFINNFIIRVGSGIVIFRQGLEKFTGDFTLNGLVPVIRDNTDSPQWYKWFFENIVSHSTGLFNFIIPLEMAIGLGLILGVLAYTASFFGAFVMINYILADMILRTLYN